MTASALQSASIAHAGAAHPGAQAAAGGALAGFDALLAALFPQGAPNEIAQASPQAPGATPAAPLLAPALNAEDTDGQGEPAADAQPADATAADADVAAAIAATLIAPQPAAAPAVATTAAGAGAATDTSAHTPPAWGRDKAKGAPAQPAILHANPHASLAEKAGLTAPSADDEPVEDAPIPPAAAAKANPQAAAAPTPRAGSPAAPTQAANLPAPATADATPELAAAPPPAPSEPAPLENAPPALQAQAMAAAERPEQAHAPQPANRPAKTERGKATTDTPSDLKPVDAADKPIQAKAVDSAAKAAAASADAGEPKTAEVETSAEAPDAAVPAETRAAAQSAAPAAHATHAVRGSPETVAHLAAQIIKRLEGQSTRFDLELNPQGLGKVDVRVEIGAHGQLTAAMMFDNAQAATELKARAAELQRALEQAGFDLSGGISFDVAGDPRQQGQAWQEQGQAGSAFRGQAFRAALETAGDVADAAAQGALRLRRGVNAGLDLRI